jgi:Flp pilus assembly secretin CpaC
VPRHLRRSTRREEQEYQMRVHLRRGGLIVATLAALCTAGPALAAGETIDVTIDFAKVMKLTAPAHTIIIGNPGIADATVDDEQTLVLTGKTAGTTNLIVLDESGGEVMNAVIRVSSDIRQLTTVFYGASRQTFSCAPVCEQVISVGDNKDKFEAATSQINTRKDFAAGK